MQDIANWVVLGLFFVVLFGLVEVVRLLNRMSDQLAALLRAAQEQRTTPTVQSPFDASAQAAGYLHDIEKHVQELIRVTEAAAIRPGEIVDVSVGFNGKVTSWMKKQGDFVMRKDPLLAFSSEMLDAEIPAPITGTICEVLVPAGVSVTERTVLARIRAQRSKEPAA